MHVDRTVKPGPERVRGAPEVDRRRQLGRSLHTDVPERPRNPETRAGPRHTVPAGRFEPVWIVAAEATIGGQAMLVNASAGGLCVALDRRPARKLVHALEDALYTQGWVEISRIPWDYHRRARVAWSDDRDSRYTRFGFSVLPALGDWVVHMGELSVAQR